MARLAPLVAAGEARIPQIGLGTFRLEGEACSELVATALRLGYRHVDTAQGYGNEAAVGAGIARSGVPRDEVFITTKVQPQYLADGDLQHSVEESLVRLGTSTIDLLLLHWPNPQIPLADSIRALNDVKRRGLVRHIGLSNFTAALLEEAVRLTAEPLATEQLEYHPYLDQTTMLRRLRESGLAVTAYCPLALGRVSGDPTIERIAKAHGKTAAQVGLRWLVQQPDVIAIPKTSHAGRLEENLAVFDFRLSERDVADINGLVQPGSRLINEPAWVPRWDS
jgi:2,5-diketo-D-gluconate reductase B